MEKIYFTLEEANALIPYLKDGIKRLKVIKAEIAQIVRSLGEQGIDFSNLFQKQDLTPEEAQYRKTLEDLGDQINDLISEIQEKGVVVKDIELGLVDFLARVDNDDVYLCWKLGEDEVQFWHTLNEGFGGRKSLFDRHILENVTKLH